MDHQIVAVSEHPGLAPVVTGWLADAFDIPAARTVDEIMALILAPPPTGPEETFVLLHRGTPVGTASLAQKGLHTRPDLAPWLDGVFVVPGFRGQGGAKALVRQVEAFARSASVPTLWLCTRKAEALYAGLGWRRVGVETDPKRGVELVLMRRHLAASRRVRGVR